jgi:predicted transcriptional regulator
VGSFTVSAEYLMDPWKKHPQLNVLHKNIIRVAYNLRKKQRIFDMASLFEKCVQELPNPEPEIDLAIRELYQMKFIVVGKQLFKSEILENEKRRRLYNYIVDNPGTHQREIRREIGLGAYEASIHLAFLMKFGFIRKNKFKNKNVYFELDFDESLELKTVLLREETNHLIYETIETADRIRLSELSNLLEIPYTTVQTHLNDLLEAGLIQKIQQDQTSYYIATASAAAAAPQAPSTPPPTQGLVEVKREYDYVGGQIRFKVAVRNFTNMAIHNIGVNLNPSDQFTISVAQQQIANLPSNSTRGIDFYLIPRTCGQSKVFGSLSFEDAYGKVHTETIEPKEIRIKCPLVKPLEATQAEVNEWIQNLKRGTSTINYHSITDEEAFRIGQEQVSALDLTEIILDPTKKYGLYTGQVKVTGKDMAIKVSVQNPHIVLDVWTDDMKQTTGFLAYITNLINIALDVSYKTVQKTKEVIGKIGNLMKICGHADKICNHLENLQPISLIQEGLSHIHDLIERTDTDLSFAQSLQVWQSKFTSMFDPQTPIEKSVAISLQYDIIKWLRDIQELLKSYMNVYKMTFDDLNHVSEDISSGIQTIYDKIAIHEKRYALGLLSYLLVLDKQSGICIFEKDFSALKINPDLVGGFLHALQSFGVEISATDAAMKTLTYENYQFQIETGEYVRAALILQGVPNEYITSRLTRFVTMFEQMFQKELVNYSGDAQPFQVADRLFDSIFK